MTVLTSYPQMRAHFAVPAAPIALDGFPEWPGPAQADGTIGSGASNLRKSGFDGTIKAITKNGLGHTFLLPVGGVGPLIDYTKLPAGEPVFPIQITCNNFADDAVPGAHDFVWYVSQRRDPGFYPVIGSVTPVEFLASEQCFAVTTPNPISKSGFIAIDTNSASITKLLGSFTDPPTLATDAALTIILRNVQVYVKRVSDGAVQYCSLYRRLTA